MNLKSNMKKNKFNGAVCFDHSENISLQDSIFGDSYRKELKEINKHDVIVKIAELIGPSPCELNKAEKIFEKMKYVIANYIIHHEYNSNEGVCADLLVWLDSQTNPCKVRKLNNFISKFHRKD